jgi:hypothetical protein
MADTRKTERIKSVCVEDREIVRTLRKICQEVQEKAQGDMTLPPDPRDRIVALNMMNNVFDRIDAALDQYLKKATGSFRVVTKGDDHALEQGVALTMNNGDQRR